MQGCWVRRDAPLSGRTREGVRRRVEVRDRKVAEVEADIGQVRLLEGHKVRVVEVPPVDVPRVERTDRDGTTGVAVLWVVVRLDPRVWHRERVLNPLRHAVVGEAIGISGEAAIDRRRVAQQVGAVRARVPIVWTPPTKYVGVGQVGLGPHTVGPLRSLANEVSHWIWVPLFTSAGVLLTTMLPSPPKGPSDR